MAAQQKTNFLQAASQWEQVAAVKFVEQTTESRYVTIYHVTTPPFSDVGRRDSVGSVRANFLPSDPKGFWVLVHELGHTLGFIHEHSRPQLGGIPSRDTYVYVDGSLSSTYNFFLWPATEISTFTNYYDCDSIMHYEAVPGPVDAPALFYAKTPSCAALIGQRTHLSNGDRAAVIAAYGPFGLNVLTVDVVSNGGTGTVSVEPRGAILSGSTSTHMRQQFPRACQVNLTAIPDLPSRSIFGAWTGVDVANYLVASVKMLSDRETSARFEANPPPPDDTGCWAWNSSLQRWEYTCPDDPKPCWGANPPRDCRRKPPNGCWHWDYSAKAWVADICGEYPSARDPNPPLTIAGTISVSGDPNDKFGPKGVGSLRYISGSESLRYSVLFENVPQATAAAAVVVIKDALSTSTLDLSTLKLGPISFGSQIITPPSVPLVSLGTYTTNVDLRPGQPLGVRVMASLDSGTGILTWTFTTLDPATGLPPADPLAGFLPPAGEGSVSFSVAARPGLATGTQFTNKASIIFDANAPMDTPVRSNVIDGTAPTSRVSTLPANQTTSCFRPFWSGSDVGAGIRGFSILVSDNGGPFTAWLNNSTATSALFSGQPGHTYRFHSQARDLVGNTEGAKTLAEATTTVGASASCNGRPSLSGTVSSKASVGTIMTLGLQLTNSGLGDAQNINISQITFRTITGTGTVTLVGQAMPVTMGSLLAGGSTNLTLTLNVPATVRQFSITEQGTLQDLLGTRYSVSIAQTVIP